jgi:hypothetical protein
LRKRIECGCSPPVSQPSPGPTRTAWPKPKEGPNDAKTLLSLDPDTANVLAENDIGVEPIAPTAEAAEALNEAFRVDLFDAGLTIGSVTIRATAG